MFGPPKRKVSCTPRHRRSFSRMSSISSRSPKLPTSHNIRVLLRVRPHTPREEERRYRDVVEVLDENLIIFDPKEDHDPFYVHGRLQRHRDITKPIRKNLQFGFDQVYGTEANNEEIYITSIKNLIDSLLDGYNCSVFAYGATGSGKTHTMLGTTELPGITPLLMEELYDTLAKQVNYNTEISISYLEVYNETVHDLLVERRRVLQLREDSVSVFVSDLTWHRPKNTDELMSMLHQGNERRTQHPTDANAESSRSHAVFQVRVILKMKRRSSGSTLTSRSSITRCAKLAMIDLAGSERAAATRNRAERFIEGANINKSLLSLGNCINALADGQQHVPFRNSKLTRLLKDSLGGNCRTVMIATISPCSIAYEDTYNTLKYATRAKKIKTRARKNQVSVGLTPAEFEEAISRKQAEVVSLKAQLAKQNEKLSQLQSLVPQSGLAVAEPNNSDKTILRELHDNLECLLKAKLKLAMATDTHANLQASLGKMHARCEDKKVKLFRAKILFPDDVKNEKEDMVDERSAAPRLALEIQLEQAQREVQTRREVVQQTVHRLQSWAEARGERCLLDLLATLHQLMDYTAQPDYVQCKVEHECLKDILNLKMLDQESFQKAFCLLAENYQTVFFVLKGLKFSSPDIEENFDKLRGVVRSQYSVSWKDQQSLVGECSSACGGDVSQVNGGRVG